MDNSLLAPGIVNCSLINIFSLFGGRRKLTRDGNLIGTYKQQFFTLTRKFNAEFSGSEYTFVLQPLSLTTVIRNETTGKEIGTYNTDMLGLKGELNIGGQVYTWALVNIINGKRQWLDSQGNPVVEFTFSALGLSFKMEILPNQLPSETVAILLFWGCCLITQSTK